MAAIFYALLDPTHGASTILLRLSLEAFQVTCTSIQSAATIYGDDVSVVVTCSIDHRSGDQGGQSKKCILYYWKKYLVLMLHIWKYKFRLRIVLRYYRSYFKILWILCWLIVFSTPIWTLGMAAKKSNLDLKHATSIEYHICYSILRSFDIQNKEQKIQID